VGVSGAARGTLSVAGPSAGISKPGLSAKGGISGNAGISGIAGISGGVGGKFKKDKGQSKQLKLEFHQKAIAAGSGCSLCQTKFTLTKRPVLYCFHMRLKYLLIYSCFITCSINVRNAVVKYAARAATFRSLRLHSGLHDHAVCAKLAS
jgi:hypothetical protein